MHLIWQIEMLQMKDCLHYDENIVYNPMQKIMKLLPRCKDTISVQVLKLKLNRRTLDLKCDWYAEVWWSCKS